MGLSKNIRVFSMVLSCLGGCSSQEGPLYAPPEFGCERSGKFELLTGELPVGNVTDIWEYGPVLIVQGSGGGFLFHVFDKRSGEPLCGFVRNGRGPGEAVSLLNAHLGEDGVFTCYDYRARNVLTIHADSMLARGVAAVATERYEMPDCCRAIVPLDGKRLYMNRTVVKNEHTETISRLELKDAGNRVVSRYDTYPAVDREILLRIYGLPPFAVSPDGRRLAVGTLTGGILETFSLERGIEPLATRYLVEPHVNTGEAFAFDEREVNCFVDLFATRDRIYAPYDGELRVKEFFETPVERRPLQFHRIAVFDWDGHALERITTDWNIRAMCVGADGTIYAALYDKLSRVFLGRIVPSEGEEALRR